MVLGTYMPLHGSRETTHAAIEDEMERAFESDDDEHDTTPLAQQSARHTQSNQTRTSLQEGAYDFEREYDHPPPGSPPSSSHPIAVGNSNGIIPSSSSILRPSSLGKRTRPSFFRRAVGVLLPQHYSPVPTHDSEVVGSGMDNDGVFSNVSARPAPSRTVRDENGVVQVMPEDVQDEVPPSYAAAQADAAPPYWETTIHAPGLGGDDDFLIDGLPAGSIFSFAWNLLISVSFQFVGFMLTYLLSTSHAAKHGSRAGLGVTLIQYGLFSRLENDSDVFGGGADDDDGATTLPSQTGRHTRRDYRSLSLRFWSTSTNQGDQNDRVVMVSNGAMNEWISFILITVGWILLLSSIFGFIRIKRWERSVRTPTPASLTTEAQQRDVEVRARLANAFGMDYLLHDEDDSHAREIPLANDGPNRNANLAEPSNEDERLRHYLTGSGFF